MRTILATNVPELNEFIMNDIPDVDVIIHDIETQTEALKQIVETQNIDLIVITDMLRGSSGLTEFIDEVIRVKAAYTRVCYIAKDYNADLLKALTKHNISYLKAGTQSINEFFNSMIDDADDSGGVLIKTKVVREVEKITNTVVETIRVKKLILTVWDNAEFGCELAYAAAKLSGLNVLVIDLDLLAPKADLFMNVNIHPDKITYSESILDSTSGLDIVMGAIDKNTFSSGLLFEAAVKRGELNNLYILTGNYKLENYEYYSDKSLFTLIEKAYQTFDITILLVNKYIYDSYTVISLIKSDFNIVPVKPDVDQLREFNDYIVFLKEKQHIPMEKYRFVAYEFKGGISLEDKILDEVTGHTYIGKVSHFEKRERYRNLKVPFVRRMDKVALADYTKILEYFSIIPAKTLKDKLKSLGLAFFIEFFRPSVKFIKKLTKCFGGRRY